MTLRIDQFYTTVSSGDATSKQILNLQEMLHRMGYKSDIFCEYQPTQFERKTWQMMQYSHFANHKNILLLHYSLTYSSFVMDWLRKIPSRKIIIYHNITPHTYFWGINDVFYDAAYTGRKQLPFLRELTEIGWGDSQFNCKELVTNGWETSQVLPIIFNSAQLSQKPKQKLLKQLSNQINILFVGRMAPNKHIEDLILTFYYLKRRIFPNARLFLVGSIQGMERYISYLQTLADQLNLSDVIFTGHISASELVTYYHGADIFLSMSEHEGFGVPLLESMYFDLPIIAYKAAAVPEVLGDSGIMLDTKHFPAIAELIGIVLEDQALRDEIIARQHTQLQNFLPMTVQKQVQSLLSAL